MSETTWADWLRAAMAERGWSQAELVRQSEGHIKADRVSKWLAGKETASHKFAIIAANTFGKSHTEALRAAGFSDAADDLERRREKLDQHLFAKPTQGMLVEILKDVPDSEILRLLQLRAEQRESEALEPLGVASGSKIALSRALRDNVKRVSGDSDTPETRRKRDYDLATKNRSQNRGEDTGE